ncbi:hypothetical protein SAMN05192559_10365 [Halobacillus karajensis]|uniref:Uncharacterized protein n=1 Tax=Halobacillus karajensis TaxID=195088 RepID=A0A024P3J7_9BACI|nr:hypothetical protein [Halobacillus karajensis]CDQ19991.1 hypothetical protein BN982_02298 [Halobacillus karajensis]CDQ22451.1 hypothetical protein BN983_00659 [Halobacillus karajensis]CDQ28294.1 hypothetical protein BN981_02588 [Halobacillus karajensis]SEH68556.1 hypothetical protein SAMN05192559_10365 [Halobacillus karajensis]
MTEGQMEEVFADYGYQRLYNRFKTPLYVTGILDDVEADLLEDFFENIELPPSAFFDEFRFWFQYFSVSQKHPFQ